jgi:hypothetical protein
MLQNDSAAGGIGSDNRLPSVLPTRIITYAWGEKYIGELLTMTLPALLAPGNLPYVASVVPCELIILAEEAFFPRFLGDPTVAGIRELCRVRLVGLDDLIPSPEKYGIALTHVLHRGFIDLGPSVTDTWLLFLNADFILADGSLRNLMRHLAEGKRLVASPSYCVNAEAVVPELLQRVDPHTRTLSLSHREMAALVIRHRHNTIRGKTVNQSFFSARYMDQFYWLADNNTLLGHQMPIAIVGMRPERYLAEPNSYWDHGLMKELFPTCEHFVMGDSDEFLMLELRGENVAQDQMRTGWPDPTEIARNFTSFLTPYQKEMARFPLTLHAADLPADVDDARAKLRAFVDGVFAHVPAVLPSHLDHPQWDYHRPGFIEARHKYLSARLGSTTETTDPPASLTGLDTVWWKLDGRIKTHSRQRAELLYLQSHQRSVMAGILDRMEEVTQRRRLEIDEQLMREIEAIEIDAAARNKSVDLNRVVQWRPDKTGCGLSASVADPQEPWVAPILRGAEEWRSFEAQVREKKELLTKAMDFIDKHYQDRILQLDLEFESARQRLQSDYERLLKRRVASATIPHLVIRRGPQSSAAPSNSLIRFASDLYYKHYGKLPRVQPLHPYWAPLRHLVRLVDTATRDGAANVLVIAGTKGIAEAVADHLPGLHVQVSLLEVVQGNLMKAFSQPPDFDLCVCTLGSGEQYQFADVVKTVAPCMRSGGKIIGFHPNFGLDPLSMDDTNLLRGMFDFPWSRRIYYAGTAKSARVVQRCYRAHWATNSRLGTLLRVATMLFVIAPAAASANKLEAAVGEDEAARMPEQCTSITIEVTV